MKGAFRRWGWIYRPANSTGWALTIVSFALIIWIFIVIDRRSHSGSDTLTGTFPWAWMILATLNWIASKTVEEPEMRMLNARFSESPLTSFYESQALGPAELHH